MYEEIMGNIYDAVSNNDSTPEIEAEIENLLNVFEENPTQDNALAIGSMFEYRGFYLGFEAAIALFMHKKK